MWCNFLAVFVQPSLSKLRQGITNLDELKLNCEKLNFLSSVNCMM